MSIIAESGENPIVHLLDHLNDQQRRAVTSDRKQVVILAGPGSGKTRIIVHRVAYLLKCLKMNPRKIIVATFTNKAARELKERVATLVEPELAGQLILGTFHHILVNFLRKYGGWMNLKKFNIVDQEDANAIVRELVGKDPAGVEYTGPAKKQIVDTVIRCISKAKARNIPPAEFLPHFKGEVDPPFIQKMYSQYQDHLRRNSLLDFDDILVFGLQLFTQFPSLARRIDHVLIDEFQDTNTIQFLIMSKIIEQSQYVTVVGDPDQSIYGWRSADITNLKRFQENYSDVDMVFLEQNYRSTKSILRASLNVISQDAERIAKGLWTENGEGASVVLKTCRTLSHQAEFVVKEIQRLRNHGRGMLDWNDFVVLYRMNRFSSSVEQHLRLAKIPYCIVGGMKFFDRKEIKDILAYMRLADNPDDMLSFSRVINVPPRKIGEKTLAQIFTSAEKYSIGVFEVCEQICAGAKGLARVSAAHLKPFVNTILNVRKITDQNATIADIIDYIVKSVKYDEYLQTSFKTEHEERMAHIADLVTYAKIAENDLRSRMELERQTAEENATETEVEDDGLPRDVREDSMFSMFLAELALQSNDDAISKKEGQKNCVTLMTLHSAKGLEFPAVFLVGAQEGVIPHNMSNDAAEERRLLYVGMTRAKGLLYVTYSQQHPYDFSRNCQWSPFVASLISSSSVENALRPNLIIDDKMKTFVENRKVLSPKALVELAEVLGRQFDPDAPVLAADPEDREISSPPPNRFQGRQWSYRGNYGGGNYAKYGGENKNHDHGGSPKWPNRWGASSNDKAYANMAQSAQPVASGFKSAAKMSASMRALQSWPKGKNDGRTWAERREELARADREEQARLRLNVHEKETSASHVIDDERHPTASAKNAEETKKLKQEATGEELIHPKPKKIKPEENIVAANIYRQMSANHIQRRINMAKHWA